MTVYEVTTVLRYTGTTSDDKPVGVPPGSEFVDTDTGRTWIAIDDGHNWSDTDLTP